MYVYVCEDTGTVPTFHLIVVRFVKILRQQLPAHPPLLVPLTWSVLFLLFGLRVDLTERYLPFLRMLFRLPSAGPTWEPSCREGDNLSGKAIDSERAGVEGSSGVGFHRFRVRY